MDKPVIFLMGPTASGKTSLAFDLMDKFPVDAISVDSALIYRGMDVGTAKPYRETLKRYPHALIDICEPDEVYSAARFREDALSLIAASHNQNRIPLFVGGTMLYFRALEYGLSDLPESDPLIKAKLESKIKAEGSAALHARLKEVDPASAEHIHPNDPQRIIRALEVFELSGKPMSEWWVKQEKHSLPNPIHKYALLPDRAVLHERIAQRFEEMLNKGLIEEVSHLKERGINPETPAMRSVGYRQVLQYLAGEFDRETMRHKGIVATRRLAKRQITWLRSEKNLVIVDPAEQNQLENLVCSIAALCNTDLSKE
ncbi:MAG: tRNA (adenosine(37)-N6)-dimethylallyltransferase MiaA [Gammaproteobacteria bacterium]|nr:tRNA (adenosine(37)-N6)-dimethylallyltransferase MiaA [Gammaproteobacteria bacterium]